MRTFETLDDLAACVGQEVAVSDWVTITQEQVNRFAEATGDHQWIHVDVERARQRCVLTPGQCGKGQAKHQQEQGYTF